MCPPGAPGAGGQLTFAKHRAGSNSNPSAGGSGGEMSVNEVRRTYRPTIDHRRRLHIARPADRRSAQPNIEMATDAEAVLAAAGSHGQGASIAAARRASELAHEGPLDTLRGVMC